ncbi:hypothetical protein BWK47_10730 [Synechocystis sp. CACIAM 05]|nr:hypothetical protein BWK47_10730 [Synechocystis sp. CACIAM 05]
MLSQELAMYRELVTNKINPGLLKGKSFLTLEGGMGKTGKIPQTVFQKLGFGCLIPPSPPAEGGNAHESPPPLFRPEL